MTLRKAKRLMPSDIAAMKSAGITAVVVAMPEPGDLGEDEAANTIAAAIAGPGIDLRPASTGRVNLHARTAGVFTVDKHAVDTINAIHPSVTVATLAEFATVLPGQMVATVKIIPFAVPSALCDKAVSLAGHRRVATVAAFQPARLGLIQTFVESTKPSVLHKTVQVVMNRIERSGSTLTGERRIVHEPEALAAALAEVCPANDLILIFGAAAVTDLLDVVPQAIMLAGGKVERVGMPVDPGNLLVLGTIGSTRVIGAPGCARGPQRNGMDMVLDRLLAGLPMTSADIAGMGVGGLLIESRSRLPPRERDPASGCFVGAVLLAAGRSARMGGPHKLLATFDGVALVRRVADMLAGSHAHVTVAVTGHEAERVTAALAGADVQIVHNRAYAAGQAGSIRAGLLALPPDTAGALIVLADMPAVTHAHVDRMIAAFVEAGGQAIVRATHAGQRGNPVIIPRALFDDVARLTGDAGARQVVDNSDLPVIAIEIGAAASLDVDTPQEMAQAGGVLQH